MYSRLIRQSQGFTLIELIVAMVVLGTLSAVIILLNGSLFAYDSDVRLMQTGAERLQACAETVVTARRSAPTGYGTDFTALCSGLGGDGFNAPTVTVNTSPPAAGVNDACPSGESCKWVVISLKRTGSLTDALVPLTIRLMDY